MKRITIIATLLVCVLAHVASLVSGSDPKPPIDPVRGRASMQKASRGEALTDEEKASLERVKQAIRERAAAKKQIAPKGAQPRRPIVVNRDDWKPLVPITDMTAPYKGED